MMDIKETIIVEGRDDTAAVKRSVNALTIETHGYGIRPSTWELIKKAYETTGIIVFTDPDHAGEQIRKCMLDRFPGAGEAFLDRKDAELNGDVGIENASPEAIRAALAGAHVAQHEADIFTSDDMFRLGMSGTTGAALLRQNIGKRLGIGFANAHTFLQRLNKFGIKRDELERVLEEIKRETGEEANI